MSAVVNGKAPCVYILASKRNETLNTGVISDLIKRVWQHKNNISNASQNAVVCTDLFGSNNARRWKLRLRVKKP